jgi:hypothetical protein
MKLTIVGDIHLGMWMKLNKKRFLKLRLDFMTKKTYRCKILRQISKL